MKRKNDNPLKILFVGNSKTFINMYREFTIEIANSKGYSFVGTHPKENFINYNNTSNNCYYIDVDNNNTIPNSFYSFTQSGKSLKYNYDTMIKKYKKTMENLKIDYVILQEQADTLLDYNTYESGVENIIKLLIKNNPDLKVFIRNTWLLNNSSTNDIKKAKENTKKLLRV